MRHLQRARDRRRGQRQHVDLRAQLLEPLLVGDAEALLLVDDEQAEVLEAHVARQQPVRADDDVDLARRRAPPTVSCCSALAAEARQRPRRGPGSRAKRSREGAEVLLGEHRGRRQHRHLLAAQHRLQRRAQRDLGLAVADVAADQAIHRARRARMSASTVVDGLAPGRASPRTGRSPRTRGTSRRAPGRRGRAAPRAARRAAAAPRRSCATSARDLAARLLCQVLPPSLSSLGAIALGAGVALDLAEAVDRQVERAAVVLEVQEVDRHLLGPRAQRQLGQPLVEADAVLLVDDEVARLAGA